MNFRFRKKAAEMSDVRLREISDILTVLTAPDRNQIGAARVGIEPPFSLDNLAIAVHPVQQLVYVLTPKAGCGHDVRWRHKLVRF
jgi:hypothetical protein